MTIKQQMKTISELIADGWNKELIYRIAHMKDTPFFRSCPKGKFYVVEENLKEFVKTRRVGR